MTVYQCTTCGNAHDSSGPACPQTFAVAVVTTPPTAREVGAKIREMLLSLKAPGGGYATDDLRMEALMHAGICWLTPGEMAPQCCCPWSPEETAGPMRELVARFPNEELVFRLGQMKA